MCERALHDPRKLNYREKNPPFEVMLSSKQRRALYIWTEIPKNWKGLRYGYPISMTSVAQSRYSQKPQKTTSATVRTKKVSLTLPKRHHMNFRRKGKPSGMIYRKSTLMRMRNHDPLHRQKHALRRESKIHQYLKIESRCIPIAYSKILGLNPLCIPWPSTRKGAL